MYMVPFGGPCLTHRAQQDGCSVDPRPGAGTVGTLPCRWGERDPRIYAAVTKKVTPATFKRWTVGPGAGAQGVCRSVSIKPGDRMA